MGEYISKLWLTATADPIKLALVLVAIVSAVYLVLAYRKQFRLTDGKDEVDGLFGIVAGAILGALTGVLWATFNPIQLAPGIHLRLFAFFIPVFGILFGRATGFVSGYVATMVWAQLSGLFVPFHSPIVDGIFVGLTGWIPAFLIRGTKTNQELQADIQSRGRAWYIETALVCLYAGLFMSVFVGVSLEATIGLPFGTGFGLIGIVSDTPPMIVLTGVAVAALLGVTRRSWSWMRTF